MLRGRWRFRRGSYHSAFRAGWASLLAVGVLMAFILCSAVAAQLPEGLSVAHSGQAYATAPVVIDGRTLFRVRGTTAFPAQQRAAEIAERIIDFAADRSQSVSVLHTEEVEAGTQILAGTVPLMLVVDEDGRVEGVGRRIMAKTYVGAIANAVASYRYERTRPQLIRDAVLTLAATAAAIVAAFLLLRLVRTLTALIARRYHRRVERIEAGSYQLIRAETIWDVTRTIAVIVAVILAAAGAYVYLNFVLSLYPWTRGAADELLTILVRPIIGITTRMLMAIPGLVVVVVIVLAARYALRLAGRFFDAIGEGRIRLASFEAEWAGPTLRIVRLLVVVFAAIVAYPYIPGSQSDAFKGISIFAGILFSLGSTSLIANLIAGYTMTYRRAFRVGDRIAIGHTVGVVSEVRLLVTRLRSVKNEELIIPNSTILASEVTNLSSLARERGLILHTTVGIGYETPWRQVEAMLLMAAGRTPGLLRDPPPFVLQKELGDFCVTYELNVYCDRPLEMDHLYAALHRSILDVFNEYAVQIMTPAYRADPPEPKIVPKSQWYTAPAPQKAREDEVRVDEQSLAHSGPDH